MEQEEFQGDFRSMFLDALRNALESALYKNLVSRIDGEASALIANALPGVTADHVESCAWFAAAYRILADQGDIDALAALHSVIDQYGAAASEYTSRFLDQAADPFRRLVDESKMRERDYFGDAFAFERPADSADEYRLEVVGCGFHRIFVYWQVPELTALFCRLDEAWIRSIDSHKHHIRFDRPTTIGHGDDRCRFHFYRVPESGGEK